MKKQYRGFELEVEREKCLGGWSMLYFSAIRKSDGWIMIDSFEDSDETIKDMMKSVTRLIDEYYENSSLYED